MWNKIHIYNDTKIDSINGFINNLYLLEDVMNTSFNY
jgi:hypothetical protein